MGNIWQKFCCFSLSYNASHLATVPDDPASLLSLEAALGLPASQAGVGEPQAGEEGKEGGWGLRNFQWQWVVVAVIVIVAGA